MNPAFLFMSLNDYIPQRQLVKMCQIHSSVFFLKDATATVKIDNKKSESPSLNVTQTQLLTYFN